MRIRFLAGYIIGTNQTARHRRLAEAVASLMCPDLREYVDAVTQAMNSPIVA
ncbi:MAG: hypothetical protein WA231_25225 [Methylocella sp.]